MEGTTNKISSEILIKLWLAEKPREMQIIILIENLEQFLLVN